MRKTILVLAAGIAFSTLLCGAFLPRQTFGFKDSGIIDGYYWADFTREMAQDTKCPLIANSMKISALRGAYEGLFMGNSPKVQEHKYPLVDSYWPLVEAVDQFYSDYQNKPLSLVWALEIINMELRGKPRKEIDERVRYFRAFIADHKKPL